MSQCPVKSRMLCFTCRGQDVTLAVVNHISLSMLITVDANSLMPRETGFLLAENSAKVKMTEKLDVVRE